MPETETALIVAALVLAVNLPFGFWRAGVQKFTLPWFVAVHAPVPLVVGLRMLAGLRWRIGTLPILVGAFFLGQFLGGRLRASSQPSSRR
jgi:hypothetical protein